MGVRLLAQTRIELNGLRKLEGYTDDEIAVRLGCVTRTVERELARIHRMWGREMRD